MYKRQVDERTIQQHIISMKKFIQTNSVNEVQHERRQQFGVNGRGLAASQNW